ncbi:MAG: hypothetical protein ACXVXG_17955 [Nocardioidaceae bacterium]
MRTEPALRSRLSTCSTVAGSTTLNWVSPPLNFARPKLISEVVATPGCAAISLATAGLNPGDWMLVADT